MKMILILPLFLLIVGCASMFEYQPYARSAQKQPGRGGVIALHAEHREEDRNLATSLMQSNCGSKTVDIVEETEVVVGTITNSNSEMENANKRKVGSFLGTAIVTGHDGAVNTSSETLQKKEWQMKYSCL